MSANDWNTDINAAPYGTDLEVTNDLMQEPVIATRGHISRFSGKLCADQSLFTTDFGIMCCPTKWRLPAEAATP
ncbi:hypothetical protein ABNQ39_00420 (plasmid) [Azospirillum sp. A26]|uniref:hypothetical protein n=1 Tax=Azospirillum sp. A26 TaxID=3160607 RepID=UPI0036723EE6